MGSFIPKAPFDLTAFLAEVGTPKRPRFGRRMPMRDHPQPAAAADSVAVDGVADVTVPPTAK